MEKKLLSCSGYVAWVTAAYGPFWGFQEGVWSWLSGIVDNSLYPAMLAANLQLFIPVLGVEGWQRRWGQLRSCLLVYLRKLLIELSRFAEHQNVNKNASDYSV
jgi:amino acid transporter